MEERDGVYKICMKIINKYVIIICTFNEIHVEVDFLSSLFWKYRLIKVGVFKLFMIH